MLCQLSRRRGSASGFSTLALAFVLLALTLPMVVIAQSVLVAGRQATTYALGQENIRAVDSAMSDVMREIRLDQGSAGFGCTAENAEASFEKNPVRPAQDAPNRGVKITVACSPSTEVTSAERTLDLEATVEGQAAPMGRARVRYLDQWGSSDEPGAEMIVCDWKLGKDSSALASC